MKKTHNLAQVAIDEILHVGDTVVDATIKNGDASRFLASRVGDGGHVMAFSADKTEIDAMATSLFLSGLTARVEPIEKAFTEIPSYLDPSEPVAVFLFQTDAQMDGASVVSTIKQLMLYLRTHGLIVLDGLKGHAAMQAVLTYAQTLNDENYDVRLFDDLLSGEQALLIQRQ